MQNTLIRIENIKKQYESNGKWALKGVSLDLYKGEIVGLLGVNGAGKTTLSSIIATLHPPTDGDILFEGQSIYKDIPAFRQNIGFCPQKPNLSPLLTLRENLELSGRCYGLSEDLIKSRIKQLSDRFELEEYMEQQAEVLSGGYKQRFVIVRALLHDPQLIILDEPTVGLDPDIRRNLWDMIKELKAMGKTVVLTTHYIDEAEELSDRICMLHSGQIVLVETVENLKDQFKMGRLEDVFLQLIKQNKIADANIEG